MVMAMISYRDITCIADCTNDECNRKLTDKVRSNAEKWTKDVPISVADFSEGCDEYKPLVYKNKNLGSDFNEFMDEMESKNE
jgi:hypothetical protein